MLLSLISNKTPIVNVILEQEPKLFEGMKLTFDEWDKLLALEIFLKPFYETTELISTSSSKNVTISMLFPIICNIKDQLLKPDDQKDSEMIIMLKETIRESFLKRMECQENLSNFYFY